MKKSIGFFLLIAAIVSCESQQNQNAYFKTAMQAKIDSANKYLELAIADAQKGIDKMQIIAKYGTRIDSFRKEYGHLLDSLNMNYEMHRVDSASYEEIVHSLKTTKIDSNLRTLEKYEINVIRD